MSNFYGSITLEVTVRQIQHMVWWGKECSSTPLLSFLSSSCTILTHLSSICCSSNTWDHLPCCKLFSAVLSKQLAIASFSSLVSWPAMSAKIRRTALDMHLNGLLRISTFSQEATEKRICFLWCFWKNFQDQEVIRLEYEFKKHGSSAVPWSHCK